MGGRNVPAENPTFPACATTNVYAAAPPQSRCVISPGESRRHGRQTDRHTHGGVGGGGGSGGPPLVVDGRVERADGRDAKRCRRSRARTGCAAHLSSCGGGSDAAAGIVNRRTGRAVVVRGVCRPAFSGGGGGWGARRGRASAPARFRACVCV